MTALEYFKSNSAKLLMNYFFMNEDDFFKRLEDIQVFKVEEYHFNELLYYGDDVNVGVIKYDINDFEVGEICCIVNKIFYKIDYIKSRLADTGIGFEEFVSYNYILEEAEKIQ